MAYAKAVPNGVTLRIHDLDNAKQGDPHAVDGLNEDGIPYCLDETIGPL